ncbi:hypothetical protein ACHAW5_010739 [Stephanodiscus triporus]|uniref:peptidylprolyl isomerase n=1 Tax=Stephanodiscus triporus TaxID=2934178 RepID=A0ABD3NZ20_9STRA
MNSTTSSSPGNSRDDETDEHSEDEMVSEMTTIARDAYRGPSPVVARAARSRVGVVLAICLLFVACLLLAVAIAREGDKKKAEGGGGGGGGRGADADASVVVANVESEPQGGGEGGGGGGGMMGKVVEFTVANLNTNANDCARVDRELRCAPAHDNSTDKFRIRLRPGWAPLGVERFERLTASGFWDGARVFRVVPNFVSQFGISPYPDVQGGWSDAGPISDDPVVASNGRGTVAFATSGPDTRTTQIFVNTNDNWYLDGQGFSPIGEVLPAGEGYGGMEVVGEFYSGYGERPEQDKIEEEGEDYLMREFPLLSYFVRAEFVGEDETEVLDVVNQQLLPM